MTAFYNEIDPFAAAWLRELIKAGHIAPGVVDERSIEDVKPEELAGYTQVHLFAGIGVWSYALRLAGWPDDRPVWTASCPCQPFSTAGKAAGFDDKRHLWPAVHWLAQECRPTVIIGEQVASKDAAPWIDLVQSDMEAMDYAFGCVPFPSAGVGAPHIRDRAYWVAYSNDTGSQRRGERGHSADQRIVGPGGLVGGLGNPEGQRCGEAGEPGTRPEEWFTDAGATDGPGSTNGFWRNADWLGCRDGKWRPVEPGTFPLVDGATARVGRLRGYGNAINAEAAKIFIESVVGSIWNKETN